MPASPPIQPVILSGGSGTRLWPLSRALYPKQLLALRGKHTLLQATALRVARPEFLPPIVVCNNEHRFIVAEQLRAAGVDPGAILLEPEGRNTAPAAAVAAAYAAAQGAGTILIMPSDHVIDRPEAFAAAVATGIAAADAGALVTFGITPRHAETGYGYIEQGASWRGLDGCFRVNRFVEKPDLATAETMVRTGKFLWNSGIFLFPTDVFLGELQRWCPAAERAARAALEDAATDLDFLRLAAGPFSEAPSISLDHAVMEHTDLSVVVPVDMGWSDLGSWNALWDLGPRDDNGNYLVGNARTLDTRNSLVHSAERLTAVVGLNDVVVVVTDDAVLVAGRERAQDVRKIADSLKGEGRIELESHVRVYRPWGHYQTLDVGDGYQVKQIEVKPGCKLSLQLHHRRAEHWVVVQGEALVTRGDETFRLGPNQSTFIPVETRHRLENVGADVLRLIEVQSGGYLGEDDIVRFDDAYGRS